MLVSKPTHGGGAPLGIDLEAGVATIRVPAKPVPAAEADAADPPGPAASIPTRDEPPKSTDPVK